MKLRVRALGLTIGIVSGFGILVATFMSLIRGHGDTLIKLALFCFGYDVSVTGAFVGLIWGLVYGFIVGALVAALYNGLHTMLYKKGGAAA